MTIFRTIKQVPRLRKRRGDKTWESPGRKKRKFWLALAGLSVGVLALFQVDANTTQQISGVIMPLGSVVAYVVGEGLVDAASAGAPTLTVEPQDGADGNGQHPRRDHATDGHREQERDEHTVIPHA